MKEVLVGRRRLLAVLTLLVVGVALAAGVSGCGKAAKEAAQYYCPMHPTYVSDRPGDCPICNMRLVKADRPAGKQAPAASPDPGPKDTKPASSGERRVLYYRNPMDPSVTSPVPMKDAMGMAYVPVYADEAPTGDGGIEGLAPVVLEDQARRLAGIETVPARLERVSQGIRAVGMVVPDERSIRVVQTKISGWIDTLYVNFTGQAVRRGQPILAIYSPELLASQEEFLRALEASRNLASASPEASESGAALLQAARRRLELFDVPQGFIDALERTGKPRRSVTLVAPSSGYVTSKGVFEGQTVEPGMELFTVTDLSRVWIEAELYEYEAPLVQVGQEATLTLSYDEDQRFEGRVAYIYPYINPETRTLKVRFDFPNADFVLKPAMYVDVSLRAREVTGIVIPETAVLDTGLRKVAFVETSPGRFEPREVRTGVRGDGNVQVLSGVQEGEQVVVKANFLLDSESRLRSALGASGGSGGHDR